MLLIQSNTYTSNIAPSFWIPFCSHSIYSQLPCYDDIVPALLKYPVEELLDHCTMHPGVPLKPMLAHPTKSLTEVLDRFEGQTFTCEFKYDGERAQVSKK